VPSTTRSRTIGAPQQAVWELLADPHHMPRWWPGVARMEGVEEGRFTQVFTTEKGRPVRIDFAVITSQAPSVRAWSQEIPGTPFERVLNESVVEVSLEPAPDAHAGGGAPATTVTIAQHQKLRGYSKTGGFFLRRATRNKLDEALDGLERVLGGS
jgi:uncharacterized protein YndB with AHSA1/START domain